MFASFFARPLPSVCSEPMLLFHLVLVATGIRKPIGGGKEILPAEDDDTPDGGSREAWEKKFPLLQKKVFLAPSKNKKKRSFPSQWEKMVANTHRSNTKKHSWEDEEQAEASSEDGRNVLEENAHEDKWAHLFKSVDTPQPTSAPTFSSIRGVRINKHFFKVSHEHSAKSPGWASFMKRTRIQIQSSKEGDHDMYTIKKDSPMRPLKKVETAPKPKEALLFGITTEIPTTAPSPAPTGYPSLFTAVPTSAPSPLPTPMPTGIPSMVPTKEPSTPPMPRVGVQLVHNRGSDSLKIYFSNPLEILSYQFELVTQRGGTVKIWKIEGGETQVAGFEADVDDQSGLFRALGTYNSPLPIGNRHLVTNVYLENEQSNLLSRTLCLKDGEIRDKMAREIIIPTTCSGSPMAYSPGDDEPVTAGFSSCQHQCCGTILQKFPNVEAELADAFFERPEQHCGDSLYTMGMETDPCKYLRKPNGVGKYRAIAEKLCYCFGVCVGISRAPTGPPSPAPTIEPTLAPNFASATFDAVNELPPSIPTYNPTSRPTFQPTAPPTAIPTVVPTPVPTAVPSHAPLVVAGMSVPYASCPSVTHLMEGRSSSDFQDNNDHCIALKKQVDKTCHSLKGQGRFCTRECTIRMEHTPDQCDNQKKCPLLWRRYVGRKFCHTEDCRYDIKRLCGEWKFKVLPGYIKSSSHRKVIQYFSACFVCFEHYLWGGVDSKGLTGQNFGCWEEQKQSFCGGIKQHEIENLPEGHRAMLRFSENIRITKMPIFKPFGDGSDGLPTVVPTAAPTPPPSTVPTASPTLWPTFSPTPVPTALPIKDLAGMAKECRLIANKAAELCVDVESHAYDCVKECEKKVTTFYRYTPFLAKCPIAWRRVVHKQICWPTDCTKVIKYVCGASLNMAIKGSQLVPRGKRHTFMDTYYDGCDACIGHFAWSKTPIMNSGCWLAKRFNGFCGKPAYTNLPKGKKVTAFDQNKIGQLE